MGGINMLTEFKVRNFKNFRDELLFSLHTNKNYEFQDNLVREGIIKDCVIVGENASGKTNLGYAIFDIVHHLTDKHKKPYNYRHYSNLYNKDETVYFEYKFRFDDVTLEYLYEKKEVDKILRETLFIDGKKVLVNDYGEQWVELPGAETLNLEKWDHSLSLVKYVSANTMLDNDDLRSRVFQQFIDFVNGMLWFSCTEGNMYIGLCNEDGNLYEAICNQKGAVQELEAFLHEMGIDYHLVEYETGEGKNIYCVMGEKEVLLSSVLSSGTRSLIYFFFWYLKRKDVTFLYMDEFDAFYHTDLSMAVVRKILGIEDVQAVITSHNTDLLSNQLLRPDCFFKMEDNKIKAFSDLTPKALREAHNLQKMYKAGAFND